MFERVLNIQKLESTRRLQFKDSGWHSASYCTDVRALTSRTPRHVNMWLSIQKCGTAGYNHGGVKAVTDPWPKSHVAGAAALSKVWRGFSHLPHDIAIHNVDSQSARLVGRKRWSRACSCMEARAIASRRPHLRRAWQRRYRRVRPLMSSQPFFQYSDEASQFPPKGHQRHQCQGRRLSCSGHLRPRQLGQLPGTRS